MIQTEVSHTDVSTTDVSTTDATPTELLHPEPRHADLPPREPLRTEPVRHRPARRQPSPAGPARGRPSGTEAAGPEPSRPGRPSHPPQPWTEDDPYARALRSGRGPLFLRRPDGWLLPLEVERWCAAPDAADGTVLRRCRGPVIDIGCGPGRLVAALTRYRRRVLGVDVSPAAVARTRGAGGAVLRRSVFEPLPAEGRWSTALLLDGNIGIGGDPAALLGRIRQVVRPGGRLLVEAAADEVDERLTVRIEDGSGRHGGYFPWARLGPAALRAAGAAGGWTLLEEWQAHGRCFAELRA